LGVHEHYQWLKQKWVNVALHTPLNAIVSGPVAGRPFEADDPAPHTVSEAWFDVVCPRRECCYINTRDVKPAVNQVPGIEVLNHWQTLFHDVPQRCIEIVPASRKETFNLVLWGGVQDVFCSLRDFELFLTNFPQVLSLLPPFLPQQSGGLFPMRTICTAPQIRGTYPRSSNVSDLILQGQRLFIHKNSG
jgi:hypothetical protein